MSFTETPQEVADFHKRCSDQAREQFVRPSKRREVIYLALTKVMRVLGRDAAKKIIREVGKAEKLSGIDTSLHKAVIDACEAALKAEESRDDQALESLLEKKTEYLVVGDNNSKVLKSTEDWYEAVKLAKLIRRGGGSVTIFKATKG